MKNLNEIEMCDVLGGDTGALNVTVTDPAQIAAILASLQPSAAVNPYDAGNGVYYAA